MTTTRILHHADAITWLSQMRAPLRGASIVTSMPDVSEFPRFSLEEWKAWFTNAARLVLSCCPPDGVTIFYQTDIKKNGVWLDKSFLCQKVAAETGDELIAHKIICRSPPGVTSFGRIGYSHLLCFSKTIRPDTSNSSADVLPQAGPTTWTRGMGLEACRLACEFIKTNTTSHTILDPFCGHGTVLGVANDFGFHAIGVDRSLKCIRKAKSVKTGPLDCKI